jgi:hypothetical protein
MVPLDIDHDGDQDFLLGNLAPNTQFKASLKQPLTLAVNDFFKTGKSEPILSYYIQGVSYPYASRNELLEDMPSLKKRFYYYKDYAVASFNDVFTPDQQKGMLEWQVNELRNCWLEQTPRGLVLHELPITAQLSPIQGAVVTDVNQDGVGEIFADGNFYPFRVQLGREDAAKGILLQWDVKKQDLVQAPWPLGIYADGDVRDVLSVQTSDHKQLIVISKNNDRVQVIQPKKLSVNNKIYKTN